MVEEALAGADVEADGRLVQQQEARPVEQGAGDLDPALLAARELAHDIARALGQLDAGELGLRAALRLGRAEGPAARAA